MNPRDPSEIAEEESAGFFRWALPAAAGVALGVGALWWSVTIRQEAKPFLQLRDGGTTLTIDAQGESPEFRDLPASLHQAVAETLRTGRLAFGNEAALGESNQLDGGSHLIRGVAKARAGLLDEAAAEFRLLIEENPDSPLAQALLEQVETHRASSR